MSVSGIPQTGWNSSDGEWFERTGISEGPAEPDSAGLAAGTIPVYFPKGSLLFLEGQSATGVFLLRTGRAKESMSSNSGRTAIVRVLGPGVVLGLPAVLANSYHESTVETLEPCCADFLEKAVFLHMLKNSCRLGVVVASQLSRECREAYASVRRLALSGTTSGRLAQLVLRWAEFPLANLEQNAAKRRFRVILTQAEIGQLLGTTRETTSRTLQEFREKGWIATKGCVWTITNEVAIRDLAAL